MDKKELTREVLKNVRLCNGDVQYFIERGIRSRINDILKNFPYLLQNHENEANRMKAIKFVLDMLVPPSQKRKVYVDALESTGLDRKIIKSLNGEQLRAVAVTFCDVSCDAPYGIDDLVGMI